MLDKNKIYGYSYEYILEHGLPEDNCSSPIKADFDDILSRDDIGRIFPNQWVVLEPVPDKEGNRTSPYTKAKVLYYNCTDSSAAELIMDLFRSGFDAEWDNTWDARLEDVIV